MLDKMMGQFKDFAELQEFAEAQHRTIVTQSIKIKSLEDEVSHLKKLLQATSPILKLDGAMSVNNEEVIARCQLDRLRDVSQTRELTLEEARKLEIYSKIINQIENRPKVKAITTKNLSNEQLLASLNSTDE